MYRRDDSPLIYFLLFIAIGLIIFLVFLIAGEATTNAKFDQAFKSEKILIDSNQIKLGEFGHPAAANYDGEIPRLRDITDSPRKEWIRDCKGYKIEAGVTAVRAATRFTGADLITVQMPQETTGFLNVCAPKGSEVEIILWVER